MKHQTKLTQQEQEQLAAEQQQTQSPSAREFASVEEMLRHDALHTPVPPSHRPPAGGIGQSNCPPASLARLVAALLWQADPDPLMNFQAEIETLIRARYPILYIISSEEMRVQQILVEIAARRQKKVFEWSYSTGIVPAGTSIQSQKHRNAATKDPLAALDQVIEQVEPAIFLFKDFHPFLTQNNFAIIRKLKDIALHLKNSFKTIVLISPVMEIPDRAGEGNHGAESSRCRRARTWPRCSTRSSRTCSNSSRCRSTWTTPGASGCCRRRWG